MIFVDNFQCLIPNGVVVINTTSRSDNWSAGLSPFNLGPVDLYDGYQAQNVENAWQYSKVYLHQVDDNNDPSQEWWDWAVEGWRKPYAVRYPMGKGAQPLYSYWNGQKLDYIEARKQIYIPLYAREVSKRPAFKHLQDLALFNDILLLDFDAYDRHALGFTLADVVNEKNLKLGHAFVLEMLLTEQLGHAVGP